MKAEQEQSIDEENKLPFTDKKLPIGAQDFGALRELGFFYIDKTDYVYRLAHSYKMVFLSRPRRFGKSLFLSTLAAYFEGRKDVFQGLAMEELEQDWIEYPVLRLDLNAANYKDTEALLTIIESYVQDWEKEYGTSTWKDLPRRFRAVVERAHAKTGKQVVVLIDEYDKPLLETIDNPDLQWEYKKILKAFYGVLKSSDAHLRFVMLTGVTKFGQVTVFSDLNQLHDITMHRDYATALGITEEELHREFDEELHTLAKENEMSYAEAVNEVRRRYNGYRFSENAEGVYNPFSCLNLFSTAFFDNYWFHTGTPTFLVELLKKEDEDLRNVDGVQLPVEHFADYRADADTPYPVLFQAGYLTIKDYDRRHQIYTLGYPNEEVKFGFLHFLLPDYTPQKNKSPFYILHFLKELESGEVDAFMERMQQFFESIPYDLNDQSERHYQVIFYLVFTLLGKYMQTEVKSARGRADAVVKCQGPKASDTPYTFVFEFKLNGTAEEAMTQIDDKGYAIPWEAEEGRKVIKVGAEFSKETRNISRWLVG
jgi:hypothetical protein